MVEHVGMVVSGCATAAMSDGNAIEVTSPRVEEYLAASLPAGPEYSVQARADSFNLFNHTNFVGAISPAGTVTGYSTFSNNMSASTFGRVQAAFDPRIVQFALKLYF